MVILSAIRTFHDKNAFNIIDAYRRQRPYLCTCIYRVVEQCSLTFVLSDMSVRSS